MKKQLCIALCAVISSFTFGSSAAAVENPRPFFSPQQIRFHQKNVAGKTMVSSGYDKGSMTFNSNGVLTCTNYPSNITCKKWEVLSDGTLRREFTDNHTGTTVEIIAVWKLLSQSDKTLQVEQTSNNSNGVTNITVTIL